MAAKKTNWEKGTGRWGGDREWMKKKKERGKRRRDIFTHFCPR
jgi:hypothetical protein